MLPSNTKIYENIENMWYLMIIQYILIFAVVFITFLKIAVVVAEKIITIDKIGTLYGNGWIHWLIEQLVSKQHVQG